MKTLIMFAAISIILTLYFVVNAEKQIVIKGSELIPAGTDIPKVVADVSKNLAAKIQEFVSGNDSNINTNFPGDLGPAVTEEIKAKALELQEKIKDLSPEVQKKIIEIIEEHIK